MLETFHSRLISHFITFGCSYVANVCHLTMKLLPFLFSILAAPITDATPVNQGEVSQPALDHGTTNASEDGFQYLNSKTRSKGPWMDFTTKKANLAQL